MQIFHGTLRLTSQPTGDGNTTTANAEVPTNNDKEVPTPVILKAYGKAAARLETLSAGSKLLITQGTLHRGENYSYLIKPFSFVVLPNDNAMPDWQCVILAGRTTKDIDTNNRREVVNTGEFLSVTRGLAVNRSKTEADFFDIHAVSGLQDKISRAQQLLEHFGHKGAFLMVEGRLSSTALKKDDGSRTVFTKVRADRLFYGPRVGVGQGQDSQTQATAATAAQPQYSTASQTVSTPVTPAPSQSPADALPF